jgi:hydroxymethylpyrimidine pyrophosphatase-like HAD family hydrolase
MKLVRHEETGLSCKIGFELRPNNKAVIDIVHNGEYESAIVTGNALEYARKAYDNADLQGYINIWKANT